MASYHEAPGAKSCKLPGQATGSMQATRANPGYQGQATMASSELLHFFPSQSKFSRVGGLPGRPQWQATRRHPVRTPMGARSVSTQGVLSAVKFIFRTSACSHDSRGPHKIVRPPGALIPPPINSNGCPTLIATLAH